MKQFFENVCFCPKCGVARLERDYYRQAAPRPNGGGEKGRKQISHGTEWLCLICGFSFWINRSHRWDTADQLHKEHRKLRNSVKFTTECVGEQIAEAFEESEIRGRVPSTPEGSTDASE